MFMVTRVRTSIWVVVVGEREIQCFFDFGTHCFVWDPSDKVFVISLGNWLFELRGNEAVFHPELSGNLDIGIKITPFVTLYLKPRSWLF